MAEKHRDSSSTHSVYLSSNAEPIFNYCQCILNVLKGRQFFITEENFIGLARAGTQQGDIIAILDGMRTPFILRRLGNGSDFQLFGPCYLHGAMRREMDSAPIGMDHWNMIPLV